MKTNTLLNTDRPPVFCPGCSHERILYALDNAFQHMNLKGSEIVMVSDIGCSGLFDTFFHTHAFHGLHGRALTYAAGLKLARPDLHVVVTMGDGGMGIGGAHLLSACRRNLDMTLLVLNNFNFGMTGGQFSATTPSQAKAGSGFLNQLEIPMNICEVVSSAGAAYASRCSAYDKELADRIEDAIRFEGFSVVDIWGVCPGRYTRQNKLTPKMIAEELAALPQCKGIVKKNMRKEYGRHYRELAAAQKPVSSPDQIVPMFSPPESHRQEIIMLGSAGQRIITAGEILCVAGMTAGLKATQKNEYNITVLRGPSISELILSPDSIDFTGIENPTVVIALSQEGVNARKSLFSHLDENALVIQAHEVELPPCKAKIHLTDFKAQGIKTQDWATASLAVLAKLNKVINPEMLQAALKLRFKEPILTSVLELVIGYL